MLDGLGIETGVSLPGVVEASNFIARHVAGELPSRYLRAELAATRRRHNHPHDA
jgi:hypothetical protein